MPLRGQFNHMVVFLRDEMKKDEELKKIVESFPAWQKLTSETKVEDLEGIVSIPRRIEGVDVAVAFRENPSGTYKISVRTGEKANASAICENFGGGGHVRAAGCNVPGPLEHAKELLLEAVRKELTGA